MHRNSMYIYCDYIFKMPCSLYLIIDKKKKLETFFELYKQFFTELRYDLFIKKISCALKRFHSFLDSYIFNVHE